MFNPSDQKFVNSDCSGSDRGLCVAGSGFVPTDNNQEKVKNFIENYEILEAVSVGVYS